MGGQKNLERLKNLVKRKARQGRKGWLNFQHTLKELSFHQHLCASPSPLFSAVNKNAENAKAAKDSQRVT